MSKQMSIRPYAVRAKIAAQLKLRGSTSYRDAAVIDADHTPQGWIPANLRNRPADANEILLNREHRVVPNAKKETVRDEKRKISRADAKPNLNRSNRKRQPESIIAVTHRVFHPVDALLNLEASLPLGPET